MAIEKADLRREAGQRTREGLLAAALELLAQRGQDGVTLREITESAGANIAAVSYHFGSLKALCDSAIEHALERYLDEQNQAVATLAPTSTIQELAAAFIRPMVAAFAAGGRNLAVMRIVARAGIDPPRGWDRLTGKFEQGRRDVLRVLSARLPEIAERELIFRTRCVAGMLNWLALAPISAELGAMPAEQVERWLLPVVTGGFHGHSPED